MNSTNWNDYKFYLRNGYELIDVREPQETDLGIVEGATLLPLSLITHDPTILYNRKVLIYCASGNRSSSLIKNLLTTNECKLHEENLINIEGGYNCYRFIK